MLTDVRWEKEQELMRSVFPQFKPFLGRSEFGFEGHLKGPRTEQLYRVVIESERAIYPQCPPYVMLAPRIGDHWIDRKGRRALCVIRDWQPARSTFANMLLVVVKFIEEHDGVSGCASAGRCLRDRE